MFKCQQFFGQIERQTTLRRFLSAAAANASAKFVEIKDQNAKILKFPNVWLRDNCQCPECFHEHTRSRMINWKRIEANSAKPKSVHLENTQLAIEWQDAHKSVFDLSWLRARDFAPENRARYINEVYKPAPQLWGKAEYEQVRRTFEYRDVLEKDAALLAWLEALAVQGFAILKNAPANTNVVRHLAARIGFIKQTTYGDVFEVKSKPQAQNYAYLMTPLPLHTDMPYYDYKAGINILHCLVQSQSAGGANTMTDGFNVAAKLRQQYPKDFEILTKTQVDWYDIGKDGALSFHSLYRSPIICLDGDGQFARINQNTTKRDSHFTVPLEEVIPWYEAYDKFLHLAYEQLVEFKTQPGDVFVFNNIRMLHGRTAYEDSPENTRHLVGAYVDWDTIYSKLRTLKFPRT